MIGYLSKVFVFCIIALLYCKCEKSTDPVTTEKLPAEYTVLVIELESHFDNDPVKIELDNELLVQNHFTTNYTIGIAWSAILTDYPTGNHSLKVTMSDENLYHIYNFKLSDTLTVGILYYPANNQIEFHSTAGLFYRD